MRSGTGKVDSIVERSEEIKMTLKNCIAEKTIVSEGTLNKITKEALAEYEEMQKYPEKYKQYITFQEAVDEVFADK